VAQAGKVVALGATFLKTVRHFFPEFSAWLNQLPDTRYFVRQHEQLIVDRKQARDTYQDSLRSMWRNKAPPTKS
jgi:hypothetical protein